jgi:flagellar basal-body rod protein FlgG
MIRALYTAATGMNAQQANIDNVANNLANVNTTGFKKSRVEFEDLVYEQKKAPGSPTSISGEAPVGLESGLGTRASATARDFSSGNLRATGGALDLAIQGAGFFQLTLPTGEIGYTRSGNFQLNAQGQIVTPDGIPLQPAIVIPQGATSVSISKDGIVSAALSGQSAPQQIGTIQLATFQNSAGLLATGSNIYKATSASGDPIQAPPGTDGAGTLVQGMLEDSNVSVVDEMVNMILGQRAYEANSKVLKAADDMLQQVNTVVR